MTDYEAAYKKADAALTKYTASTPEYITVESVYSDISAYYSKRQTILDTIAAKAAGLFGILREIEELSAVKAALEDELKLAMAERGAEEMTAGAHRLSWKVGPSTRTDTSALKRTLPEIAARFTKESRACRFTIN